MKTEVRFLLAVFLMLVVLLGTNRLFPPTVPDGAALLGDSVAVGANGRTGDAPSAAVPDIPGVGDRVPSGGPTGERVSGAGEEAPGAPAASVPVVERWVTVSSPLYRYVFSTVGARMLSVELPQFVDLNRGGVVELVPEGADGFFGHKLVVGQDTIDLTGVPYRVEPEEGLSLREGGAPASLTFVYEHPTSSFNFEVTYTFDPASFSVGVTGQVTGVDRALLVTDMGLGLAYVEADSALEGRSMAYVYNHVSDGIRSTLLSKADPTIVEGPMAWAAFRSKFFVLAFMAGEGTEDATGARYLGGLIVRKEPHMEDRVRVGAAQSLGEDGQFSYRLFMGPQDHALLLSLGQGMEEVNPKGWRPFRPIIRPIVGIILTVLVFLHTNLSLGYGWVLIVFGVGMRVVLFPLNHKAMKAQLRNMSVQPLVKEVQDRYKDNPEKLQKEMMKLYKVHGFNPLAGCIPMLLPWPVLIALFFVFQNTIELRGVPFLWLPDLSAKDPFYILPVILALSMFLMQWVSLRSLDQDNPQMKMMMYIMPPMMLFIFLNLASGLNLYYATANIATIPQQIWIAQERKKMKGKPPPKLASD